MKRRITIALTRLGLIGGLVLLAPGLPHALRYRAGASGPTLVP